MGMNGEGVRDMKRLFVIQNKVKLLACIIRKLPVATYQGYFLCYGLGYNYVVGRVVMVPLPVYLQSGIS